MEKKVAIVVCAWPPQGGGFGGNAFYHLKQLQKIGYLTRAFTPKYKNIKSPSNQMVGYLPVIFPIGKAGFLFSLFSELKKFDVIHLYYPFFGTDLIIMLFKIFHHQKKLILHYHMDPVGLGFQKFFFKLYLKLFLPSLVMLSDKIVVLSWDHAKHSYINQYFEKNKNKFVEIPNGIEIDIFKLKPKNIQLANKYNISENNRVVIFAGGLDDQHFFKGVDVLIRSFSTVVLKNKEARLMIIGDGNKKEYYEKLANELNLKDWVIFTGWIDNEYLADYYNLGDVFVLPSIERTESFGIVIAEAQACGLPAIISNWPGSRLTIENTVTGFLVKPNDSRALAEKLIFLLENPDLMKKMGEAAIKRVGEKYSWSVVIKEIDKLYQGL